MSFTYKQIWHINTPVLVSLLMEQLITLSDTLFLGHFGETELGACALASMYGTALYMLGLGFSMGLQVIIARENGEQDYPATGKNFCQGICFLFLLAVTVIILSACISPLILGKLIHSPAIYSAAIQYVTWRNYGLLFSFPLLAIRAFYVGTTQTRILTPNAILMVICNLIFNKLLIFGFPGFEGMGIRGAAVASILAEGIAFIWLFSHLYQKIDRRRFGLSFQLDLSLMYHLFTLSFWTMIRSFFCIAPWFLFFIAIEHLGETELAAANIVRSISMLFFIIVNSFATTNISLVGNLLGAGEKQNIIPTCRKLITLGYILGIPLIIVFFIFSRQVLSLFSPDLEIIQTASYPFLVMLSTYLLSVPAYIYCNAVIGTGHTRRAFWYQIITIALYLIWLYSLSEFPGIPLAVFWTAEQLYVIILLLLSAKYIRKHYRY